VIDYTIAYSPFYDAVYGRTDIPVKNFNDLSNRTIAVPYATEAGRFQSAGVPTIVCGPGSINQAHQPDEFIEIAELSRCISFMRALAGDLS
jgi:acetylornithine deacetylase/succinyl-diaminopimelate desuccinylase-like protein